MRIHIQRALRPATIAWSVEIHTGCDSGAFANTEACVTVTRCDCGRFAGMPARVTVAWCEFAPKQRAKPARGDPSGCDERLVRRSGLCRDAFGRVVAQPRDLGSNAQDGRRLVAARGVGAQVGRIGLEEDGLRRERCGGGPRANRRTKRHRQGEADQEARRGEAGGHGGVTGERVKRTASTAAGASKPGQEGVGHIGVSIPTMDQHRLAQPCRERQLARECLPLDVGRREVAMEVETDLPHRNASRVGGQGLDARPDRLVRGGRVVGVHAHRGLHQRAVGRGELQRRFGGGDIPPGDQDAVDPGRRGALEDGLAIRVEAFVLEMAMRVSDACQPLGRAVAAQLAASSASMRGKSGRAAPVCHDGGPLAQASSASRPGPPAPRSS